MEMRLTMRCATPGRTELAMNPFGRITARTHSVPVALIASVESVRVDSIREIIDKGFDVAKIKTQIKSGGAKLCVWFLFKLFMLGAVGGAFGAAIGRRLDTRLLLSGAISGIVAIALLLAVIGIQFNTAAFNDMQYSGALNDTPFVIPDLQQGFRTGLHFSKRLDHVAENLAGMYVDGDRSRRDRILALHISDLHNNPIAAEMVCRINASIKPDIILDTGDITDLGLPLELKFLNALKCIDKPHVFVAGNHDLPSVTSELETNFGVVAPHGEMIETAGLRIIGFDSPPPFQGKSEIGRGRIRPWAQNIHRTLSSLTEKPDIIMLHYPGTARSIAGRAPVILFGHTHEPSVESIKGSLLVNAGSTGASGIRYMLRTKKRPSCSVALITFKVSNNHHPVPLYADIIRFDPQTGMVNSDRTSFVPYVD